MNNNFSKSNDKIPESDAVCTTSVAGITITTAVMQPIAPEKKPVKRVRSFAEIFGGNNSNNDSDSDNDDEQQQSSADVTDNDAGACTAGTGIRSRSTPKRHTATANITLLNPQLVLNGDEMEDEYHQGCGLLAVRSPRIPSNKKSKHEYLANRSSFH